ncbi:MAG TPA: enoyl-CoA hydratase/isomerase family protein [Ottowia sp.]|uniref:enoyl-CoA hydratase/isomerase family protein n=1 Tax=Ottowia sp. TaxID=1898956 RepID=UPI002C7D85A5|nr:enoyl-CoA hydratase/isomerase family protein [Ottowia sp.]HMN21877.1 enoyl-CoA hydratase/isomerase family protein [Ottowia sp.]
MSGEVLRADEPGGVAIVTLSNAPRLNAMTRAMWRALRQVFLDLQADPTVRCVLLRGSGGHFCAGGDIAEYPAFRFDPESLLDFHEGDVWGGLQAMLDCDVPMIAAIGGHCMGAGVELACCCDLRVASESARFGAPIARLGFPMAPRELALVVRVAGEASARQLLLEAAVLEAADLQARGFLHGVVPAHELAEHALARARGMAALAPQAARLNKQALRALASREATEATLLAIVAQAYRYADSPEHREGIEAFLAKRPARF